MHAGAVLDQQDGNGADDARQRGALPEHAEAVRAPGVRAQSEELAFARIEVLLQPFVFSRAWRGASVEEITFDTERDSAPTAAAMGAEAESIHVLQTPPPRTLVREGLARRR